jgi:hypothetical protein
MKMPLDKLLHFLSCYFLASLSLIHPMLGLSAVIGAVGKEVYDWFKYGRKLGWKQFYPMAVGDLIADFGGIFLWEIVWTIKLFLGR